MKRSSHQPGGEIRVIGRRFVERADIADVVSGGFDLFDHSGFHGKAGVVATDGDSHRNILAVDVASAV